MNELFLKVINISISASWVVLAILILRLTLKKAPKWVLVLLWSVVAIRLLCPFSMETPFSMIPSSISNGEWLSEGLDNYVGDIHIIHDNSISYDAAVNAGREAISSGEGGYYVVTAYDKLEEPPTIENTIMPIFSIIWIFGIILLILHTTIRSWCLYKKMETAVLYQENIFQSETITSPFVFGIIKPQIYLPFKISEQDLEYVIAHEKAHIHRKDHWWKFLGFLLLTIHWFNPFIWLSYILLCRDIELACDEKVIKELNHEQRANYTQALLTFSINHPMTAISPLAFGEVSIKERVKSVLNYKKPTFGIILSSIIICIAMAICFLTNPIAKNTTLMGANYSIEKILYAVTVGDEISTKPPLQYCITADYHLYFQQKEGEDWNYLGSLTPYALTNEELNNYMPVDNMQKNAMIPKITDAYILKVENNNFYFVFQTKNGRTYLAYGWEDINERGQAGSDDTRLRRLYLLNSNFYSGYVNGNFFERSLIHTIGNSVYSFANFESDKIPGYHIIGFKSGESTIPSKMTDMGFAVFQTTGKGYRLIDYHVYENATLAENGIYFCDPAVADINGEMRNDNTFDVILICNENVGKIERIYQADGKEDWIQSETNINTHHMSLWPWSNMEGYTRISQYFYDKNGNLLSANGTIPSNSELEVHTKE